MLPLLHHTEILIVLDLTLQVLDLTFLIYHRMLNLKIKNETLQYCFRRHRCDKKLLDTYQLLNVEVLDHRVRNIPEDEIERNEEDQNVIL